MNLAIDIGNQYTKLAVFDGEELVHSTAYKKFKLKKLQELHSKYPFENAILSDVSADIIKTEAWLREHTNFMMMTHDTPLPIKNKYKTPLTLGLDRIAAAVAAHAMFPGKPSLVVDAGTCITYEYVNDKGEYEGGGITPGIRIRFKALSRYTGKLPKLKRQDVDFLTGGNTEESILSGVINGTAAEINGMVERYRMEYPELQVVLTGGDALFFETYLKSGIFAVPNLVLKGLNNILIHNL